jgi:hypothetical protein
MRMAETEKIYIKKSPAARVLDVSRPTLDRYIDQGIFTLVYLDDVHKKRPRLLYREVMAKAGSALEIQAG